MGAWYGWGYCICTDWHWAVRENLGYHDKQNSYIHFLLEKFFGIQIDDRIVDQAVVIIFFMALVLSTILNIRDLRKRKSKT
jgi:hypothetical protein